MAAECQLSFFLLTITLVTLVHNRPAFGATLDLHGVKASRASLKAAAPVSALVPVASPVIASATVSPLINTTSPIGAQAMTSLSIANFRLFVTNRSFTTAFNASRFCLLFFTVGAFYLFGLRWDINISTELTEKGLAHAKAQATDDQFNFRNCMARDLTVSKDASATSHLPTIWPKFTRLHSASSLLMPLVDSDSDVWSQNVISPSGAPLLAVSLCSRNGTSRAIELITVGLGRFVLAYVAEDGFECFGLGGAKLGRFVVHEGALVLTAIDGQHITSTTKDSDGANSKVTAGSNGRLLGTQIERQASSTLAQAYLELTIEPGVDVVLVLACVMAARLFLPADVAAAKARAQEVDAN
jgi:hypothetical protein